MTANSFFNHAKLVASRKRAENIAKRRGADHHAFLHLETANTIAERLAVTQREFNSPALLFDGPFAEKIAREIRTGAPNIQQPFRSVPHPAQGNSLDMEIESADLIVSVFDCQRTNDVAELFLQINAALRPDGLFHAAMPVEGTLQELQDCLMRAELEINGGAAMRFDLFPQIRQVGDMLQRTGFKLPVCDVEKRQIRYGKLESLVDDLRGAGASAAVTGPPSMISRKVWQRTKEFYAAANGDDDTKLRATIQIGLLSGWKHHESQQKPLKPGSAKQSLKDFL